MVEKFRRHGWRRAPVGPSDNQKATGTIRAARNGSSGREPCSLPIPRFHPRWTVATIPGGLKVCDADGQSLAYVYSGENPNDAHMAKDTPSTITPALNLDVPGGLGWNPRRLAWWYKRGLHDAPLSSKKTLWRKSCHAISHSSLHMP